MNIKLAKKIAKKIISELQDRRMWEIDDDEIEEEIEEEMISIILTTK